ncbi:MAG TPA: YqcC family protein [Luteimonas sp.]|nr:YqcC family protein [Luteimonas sp.]
MTGLHDQALASADRIEAELRRIGAWRDNPLPEAAYGFRKAFAADTMAFEEWLQFVLLPRVREIAAERGNFPPRSQVGTYAIRNLDGREDCDGLIGLLCEFDYLFGP